MYNVHVINASIMPNILGIQKGVGMVNQMRTPLNINLSMILSIDNK